MEAFVGGFILGILSLISFAKMLDLDDVIRDPALLGRDGS